MAVTPTRHRQPFEGVTPARRRNMQANRSTDTKPEIFVRSLLHALGYRFRLHRSDLPGRPDIVFPGRKKIIEVRGCFWHGHGCVPLGQLPRTRTEYWGPKISKNKARDTANLSRLTGSGWEVLEVWECVVRRRDDVLEGILTEFLGPAGRLGQGLGTGDSTDASSAA
jgi:DNA mismatch endonuclease, patch repair protein